MWAGYTPAVGCAWCCKRSRRLDPEGVTVPACCAVPQFKDEPAALKLKHDAAGVVGFANSGTA